MIKQKSIMSFQSNISVLWYSEIELKTLVCVATSSTLHFEQIYTTHVHVSKYMRVLNYFDKVWKSNPYFGKKPTNVFLMFTKERLQTLFFILLK